MRTLNKLFHSKKVPESGKSLVCVETVRSHCDNVGHRNHGAGGPWEQTDRQVPDQVGLWGSKTGVWILFWVRGGHWRVWSRGNKYVIWFMLQVVSSSWLLVAESDGLSVGKSGSSDHLWGCCINPGVRRWGLWLCLWSWKLIRSSWIQDILWSRAERTDCCIEYKGKEKKKVFVFPWWKF